jgi:hypothetical protein
MGVGRQKQLAVDLASICVVAADIVSFALPRVARPVKSAADGDAGKGAEDPDDLSIHAFRFSAVRRLL